MDVQKLGDLEPFKIKELKDGLRVEAEMLLSRMFKIPEGSSRTIRRIIDCIIKSALLECSLLQIQAHSRENFSVESIVRSI